MYGDFFVSQKHEVKFKFVIIKSLLQKTAKKI